MVKLKRISIEKYIYKHVNIKTNKLVYRVTIPKKLKGLYNSSTKTFKSLDDAKRFKQEMIGTDEYKAYYLYAYNFNKRYAGKVINGMKIIRGEYINNRLKIMVMCQKCKKDSLITQHKFKYSNKPYCSMCNRLESIHNTIQKCTGNDKANYNNLSTGIKNVYKIDEYNNSNYQVRICRKGKKIVAYADTIDEAINIKQTILDYYSEYNVLPSNYKLA